MKLSDSAMSFTVKLSGVTNTDTGKVETIIENTQANTIQAFYIGS